MFYDIPMSIYAYAERHKGELVLFIACDYDSRIFYWRNIDTSAIEEFKNKSDRIRTKARYYFKDNENVVKRMLKQPSTIGVSCINRRWSPSRMRSLWQTSLLRDKNVLQCRFF